MSHWCKDIPRDIAVRAAEDGRTGPLPTLEEAIWAARAMMPKSVSPTSAPEQENKGDGMRTERVTLEVTHNEFFPVSEWSWITMLRLRPGESVRVVEEFGSALPRVVENMADDIKRLDSERDAAIRERDELRRALVVENDHALRIKAERDAAEAANASWCKAAGIMNARVADLKSQLESAPSASGAAGTEPDAWGVMRDGSVESVAHRRFRDSAEHSAKHLGGTVVPLYAAPAASGWLTEEEREALDDYTGRGTRSHHSVKIIKALLARSTPPEVVHPECQFDQFSGCSAVHAWNICAADFRKALAAAGVAVKEVG